MTAIHIVGGGVFGLSSGLELTERGHTVSITDADWSWARSSSGGDTRLLRLSHGGDAWHRDSARTARQQWLHWSELTGVEMFRETGIVWMDSSSDGWVSRSHDSLAGAGDRVQMLGEDDMLSLLPGLDPTGMSYAFLEMAGGVLFAERSLRAIRSHLEQRGVTFFTDRVTPTSAQPADATIWACGPWLADLFPDLVELEVTQQDLVNIAGPPGWHNAPAWLDFPAQWYGSGDVGTGIKVANDAHGPPLALDEPPVLLGDSIDRAKSFIASRFPGLADAAVVSTRVCQYARTPDSEFIAAPHPDRANEWLVGGGSGHGFKHGPAIGDLIADLVEGSTVPLHRHRLGPRSEGDSLRMGAP